MLKKYFNRHFRFDALLEPDPSDQQLAVPPRRQFGKGFRIAVRMLRVLPYLCLGVFLFSFYWDFGPEDSVMLLGYRLETEALLRMVAISGLIGFGTNWLAIKMLFKPVQKRPIWGQGLIPAQKDRIVYQLAGGIHRNILSEDLIQTRIRESGLLRRATRVGMKGIENLLDDPEFREELKALVRTHLESNMEREDLRERFTHIIDQKLEANLQTGLKGVIFKTYKRFNQEEYELLIASILDRIPETVEEILEELETQRGELIDALRSRAPEFEDFMMRMIVDILERIDIREILSRQMAHLDEAKLESMIWNATNEQLLYIQYLGTLLGILGGLVIWQPLIVGLTYVGIFLLLLGLDNFLYQIRKRRNLSGEA